VERQPTTAELNEARERARSDARRRANQERTGSDADEPIVAGAGPYEFAPEQARAEYDRVFEATLEELRGGGERDRDGDRE
jgi:hypothetical protein